MKVKDMIEQMTYMRYVGDVWPDYCIATLKLGISRGLSFETVSNYLIQHKKEIVK